MATIDFESLLVSFDYILGETGQEVPNDLWEYLTVLLARIETARDTKPPEPFLGRVESEKLQIFIKDLVWE